MEFNKKLLIVLLLVVALLSYWGGMVCYKNTFCESRIEIASDRAKFKADSVCWKAKIEAAKIRWELRKKIECDQ